MGEGEELVATEVDQKIVEMRFDNKQFDNGVKETMTLLEKFQAMLSFKGATKGLEDVQAAADKVNLSGLEKSANAVSVQFDAMQVVAITAIQRITNSVMTLGTQLTKSLTVDQVTAGFSKYEDKLVSVRTIMNSTGLSVEDVNKQLNKLNWFTDQTSYNFVDMVSNIGKFTNNSIKLEDAVTAMEGIANWAAISGQGINEAGRAMYNLSQAISVGSVKLMDWKSIENANMATTEFKQNVIDAAVNLGTLNKVGEKYYTTTKKMEVSATNFNEALSEGWFTSDVLMKVLSQYGEFADEVYNEVQTSRRTTEEVLAELSAKTDTVGKRAFAAAQEYKTLTDAINATKDAVSTGWMQSFEYIIGNTEQAKEVWTAVGEEIYSIFAAGAEYRNDVLKSWAALDEGLGGRTDLFNSIGEMYTNLKEIAEAAGVAFREVFPQYTVDTVSSLVKSFSDLTSQLKLSKDSLYTVRVVVKTLLVPFKLLTTVVGNAAKIFGTLVVLGFKLGDSFLSLFSNAQKVEAILRSILGDSRYERIAAAMNTIISRLGNTISTISKRVKSLFSSANGSNKLVLIFEKLTSAAAPFAGWILDKIVLGIEKIANADYSKFFKIGEFIAGAFSAGVKTVAETLPKIGDAFLTIFNAIRNGDPMDILRAIASIFVRLKDTFLEFTAAAMSSDAAKTASGFINLLVGALGKLADAFKNVIAKLTPAKILMFSFATSVVGLIFSITEVMKSVTTLTTSVSKLVTTFNSKLSAVLKLPILIQVTGAITALVTALTVLSAIDVSKLKTAGIALGVMAASLVAVYSALALVNKYIIGDNVDKFNKAAGALIAMSAAMAILGAALMIFSKADWNNVAGELLVLTGVLAMLVAAAKILSMGKKDVVSGAATMAAFGVSIGIILNSLTKLSKVPLGNIRENMLTLTVIIADMSLLALISSGVKFSGAAGMLLLSMTLTKIADSLTALSRYNTADLVSGIVNFIPVFVALGGVAVALRTASKYLVSLVKEAAIIGISAIALSFAVKQLGALDVGTITKGVAAVSALALLSAAFTRLTAVASVITGEKSGIGKTLISMATSIVVLVAAVALLGTMKTEPLIKGVLAVSILMAVMSLVIKAGSDAKSAIGSILSLTAALTILTGAIAILSFLEWDEALIAVSSLSALMASLAIAIKVIGETKFKMGGVASLIGALTALVGVAWLLTALDVKSALPAVGSLSVMLIALSGAIAIMSKSNVTDNTKLSTQALIAVGATMAALALVLRLIEDIDGVKALPSVLALSTLLAAVVASAVILSKIGDIKIDGGTVGTIVIIGAITSVLAIVLAAMGDVVGPNTLTSVLSFTAILGAMTLVTGALALISKVTKGVDFGTMLNTLGLLALVIVAVGGIAGLFGTISKDGGMAEDIMRGAEVLTAIGTAIGGFVGGIIGGVAGGASYGFITLLGKALEEFAYSIQPFIDVMNGSGGDAFARTVTAIGTAILAITAADVLDGISRFLHIGGESSLTDFGKQLEAFAPYMKSFLDMISQNGAIDATTIEAATNSAMALAAFANALPHKDGLKQSIFGEAQSLSSFGMNLEDFGNSFIPYCQKIMDAGIDSEVVDAATNSAEALAGFANALPARGGKLQTWLGEKESMAVFGEALSKFAPHFVSYWNTIKPAKIDDTAVTKSAKAAQALAAIEGSLPSRGGTFESWFGSKATLEEFGASLEVFGPALASFYESIQPIGADIVNKSENLASALTALQNGIPHDDPNWMKNLFGGSDMGEFATQLQRFGWAFEEYYDAVKDTDFTKIDTMLATIDIIANMADRFKLLDTTGLVRLSSSMETIAKNGIAAFLQGFEGSTEDIDSAAVVFTNAFTAAVSAKMEGLKDTALALAITFAQGMNEQGAKDMLEVTGKSLMWQVIEAAKTKSADMAEVGRSTIEGFIDGVVSGRDRALTAMQLLCKDIISVAEVTFDEHSPSKVFKRIGGYVVEGLANGIGDSKAMVTKVTKDVSNAVLGVFSKIFQIHSPSVVMNEMGHYLVQGLAEGITSDMSAVQAATQMANNITNAFKTAFDDLDLTANTLDLEHQLWKGMYGDTASSSELKDREAALQEKKMQMQAERVAYANAQYQAAIKAFGENATETQKFYNSYLQEMITLTDMAKTLMEGQTTAVVDQRQAVDDYVRYMQNNADKLVEMGFTMEEIQSYAQNVTGFRPQGSEDPSKTVSDIVESYLKAVEDVTIDTDIQTALSKAVSKSTSAGASSGTYSGMTQGFDSGITKAIQDITSGESPINTLLETITGKFDISSITQGNSIMGWLSSVDDNVISKGSDIINNLTDIATNGLSSFASAWGINLDTKKSETFTEIGESIPESLKDGVENPESRKAYDDALQTVIDESNDKFVLEVDAENNPGYTYGESYKKGIQNSAPSMTSTTEDTLVEVSSNAVRRSADDYRKGGKYLGEELDNGMVEGMKANIKIVIDAAKNVSQAVKEAAKKELAISSPSKVFKEIGMYVDQGFAEGLTVYSNVVSEASKDVSVTAIDSMTTAIQKASELAGDALNGDPVIRPVLDLDEMRKGFREINTMFTREQAMNVNSDIEEIRRANQNRQNGVQYKQDATSSGESFTFVQNNYSPKPLSRSEIFRQTRNQFASFKERVSRAK